MYKMLSRTDLPVLIVRWLTHATVYAPVRQDGSIQFHPLDDPAQAVLDDAVHTCYPPKAVFLPQSEAMFRVQGDRFDSTADQVEPRVILGIRPCDARASQLLDAVFVTPEDPDPYWSKKRDQTTIVALGCGDPSPTCFCTTVGTGPFDGRGADAMLTEIADGYVVEVSTGKGQAFFGHLPDASPGHVETARAIQATAASEMPRAFEPQGIRDKLHGLFDSDFWQQVQQSCLGCGVCTFLCPTCHCFDIVDEALRNERVRNWDTCMFRIYSQEASGHNPRPTQRERVRQRIMHKYAYFLELYGEIGCTGCGRCVRYCPVALDIRQVLHSAQTREETP